MVLDPTLIRERRSAAVPVGRAIERLIIDDRHLEPDLVHGAGDRNPILQLGGAGAEVVGRNRDQGVGVLTLHGVEEAAVEVLIHHEMGIPPEPIMATRRLASQDAIASASALPSAKQRRTLGWLGG